jgi:hypothetical protein
MYNTINQSCEVRLANGKVLQGYSLRPVMPAVARGKGHVKVASLDGSKTYWYTDGLVRQELPGGEIILFPAKPTLADAVKSKPDGSYYEFGADRSVTFQRGSFILHWSSTVKGPVTIGQISFTHNCKNWFAFDGECDDECTEACECVY